MIYLSGWLWDQKFSVYCVITHQNGQTCHFQLKNDKFRLKNVNFMLKTSNLGTKTTLFSVLRILFCEFHKQKSYFNFKMAIFGENNKWNDHFRSKIPFLNIFRVMGTVLKNAGVFLRRVRAEYYCERIKSENISRKSRKNLEIHE